MCCSSMHHARMPPKKNIQIDFSHESIDRSLGRSDQETDYHTVSTHEPINDQLPADGRTSWCQPMGRGPWLLLLLLQSISSSALNCSICDRAEPRKRQPSVMRFLLNLKEKSDMAKEENNCKKSLIINYWKKIIRSLTNEVT
jgi:hypothetical protein